MRQLKWSITHSPGFHAHWIPLLFNWEVRFFMKFLAKNLQIRRGGGGDSNEQGNYKRKDGAFWVSHLFSFPHKTVSLSLCSLSSRAHAMSEGPVILPGLEELNPRRNSHHLYRTRNPQWVYRSLPRQIKRIEKGRNLDLYWIILLTLWSQFNFKLQLHAASNDVGCKYN